jgi:hypothetical protein
LRFFGGLRQVVDLIRPMPKPPWKKQPDTVGSEADLRAADIQHLDRFLSAPKLRQIIIGAGSSYGTEYDVSRFSTC